MRRIGLVLVFITFGAMVNGCSTYRTIGVPHGVDSQPVEFARSENLRAGDHIRVTLYDESTVEGTVAEIDGERILLSGVSGAADLQSIPLNEIAQLRVRWASPALQRVVVVTATSVVVFAVVRGNRGGMFSPNEAK